MSVDWGRPYRAIGLTCAHRKTKQVHHTLPRKSTMVDFRINGTLQTGAVRKIKLPFYRLVGAVFNCAYSVRLETAPTGGRKCLFIFIIHHKRTPSAPTLSPDRSGSRESGHGIVSSIFINERLHLVRKSWKLSRVSVICGVSVVVSGLAVYIEWSRFARWAKLRITETPSA